MNYIKLNGLFRITYIYIDKFEPEGWYHIDRCLEPELYWRLKFTYQFMHPNWPFLLCMVKVKKKDQQEFEQVLRKLDFEMVTKFSKQYSDFKEQFRVIQLEVTGN